MNQDTKSSTGTSAARNGTGLRRFRTPITMACICSLLWVVNWATTITSEVLLPQFATSSQTIVGRSIALLGIVLLLSWLLLTGHLAWKTKGLAFGLVGLLVGGLLASIREIENSGNNNYVIHYRWQKTQDQRLAEFEKANKLVASKESSTALNWQAPSMTDFLGARRDGLVPGPAIKPDLRANEVKELWRRPVGGGYAGFVLAGGLAVTIEQRGEDEAVVAMDLKSGQDRWVTSYPGHFKESLGGNGPRATPTIAGNEAYALGASGLLCALDLATGDQLWKTNILSDANASNVTWGMCGSPLVIDQMVVVNPGGNDAQALLAYDRKTGKPIWSGGGQGNHAAGYASPIAGQLFGTNQIIMLDAVGLAGHDPADGRELWRHPFMTFNGINVCQPLVLPGDQLFVSAGYDAGSQLIKVGQTDNIWQAETVWRSKGMKCKMSSCVYLDGYIYGFDDGILACLDARDGKRNWKGGRYGHGQLLLRDRVLVIQAESGEFVLAAADPKKHRELLKIPALEGGKAWNAPAMAGDLVLLRNHFEAVLYQLPLDNQ